MALQAGLGRWVEVHPDIVGALAGVRTVGREVVRRCSRRGGLVALSHAEGGLANETILVDLGPGHPGIVVRLPPLEPTFPDYDLGPQALVQNAVAAVRRAGARRLPWS